MIKAVLFTSLGAACLVRGLLRPVRALVSHGEIRRCSGANSFGVCDPSIGVVTTAGEKVYSTLSGKVLTVGADYIHVMSRNEPVIVMYQGLTPSVAAGQYIGVGQRVGTSSGNLNFSVTQMGPGGVQLIPPSAWLAARGCKIVESGNSENALWCAQGRHISVPASARQNCGLKKPEGASFALLPVSIEMN